VQGEVTEAQFQRQVTDLAELLGWRWAHNADSRRTQAGQPDLTLIRDRVVYVELKTDTGRVRPEQESFMAALRAAGAEVYVIRPRDFEFLKAVLERRGA
jgi:lipopolysaccharide export system protein LptC